MKTTTENLLIVDITKSKPETSFEKIPRFINFAKQTSLKRVSDIPLEMSGMCKLQLVKFFDYSKAWIPGRSEEHTSELQSH